MACTSEIGIQRLMSDGLPAFARICVNRLSQTTEARIGRALKKIFLLRCFSFSKKEKSDGFNRRECAGGVAVGDVKLALVYVTNNPSVAPRQLPLHKGAFLPVSVLLSISPHSLFAPKAL